MLYWPIKVSGTVRLDLIAVLLIQELLAPVFIGLKAD
jgi:hypothetical protein